MVSASWLRRKSSNRSACEPRAPRWTSEINKVRKRRSGHSSLIASLPMREQLADFHDSAMTVDHGSCPRKNPPLETNQRIDAERRPLAPLHEPGVPVRLRPGLQP